ncbi:MAG: CDP-diacylglycerol--glycerol-3-phosphate 3-phosphatidyltransferase [Thermodesulfobacteriota bacterium]
MNIPNFLTIARILLIPVMVIFLLDGELVSAFWVFVAAGVTDGLDGFLARVLHQQTEFGAFIDPIADKLLLLTAYVSLAALGFLPKWLAVVVVSRDVLICGGIGVLMLYNRSFVIRPSLVSKMTTLLQLLTVAFHLGQQYLEGVLGYRHALILLTAAFTLISGAHYLARGFRILGSPEEATRSGIE